MSYNDAAFDGMDALLQSRRNRLQEYGDLESAMLILESIRTLVNAIDGVTEQPFRRDPESKEILNAIDSSADDLIRRCQKRILWMDELDCEGFDYYRKTGQAPFYTKLP